MHVNRRGVEIRPGWEMRRELTLGSFDPACTDKTCLGCFPVVVAVVVVLRFDSLQTDGKGSEKDMISKVEGQTGPIRLKRRARGDERM